MFIKFGSLLGFYGPLEEREGEVQNVKNLNFVLRVSHVGKR